MNPTAVDRKILTWFRGLGTEPDYLHQTNTRSYDHAARKASEVLGMPPDTILDRMLVLGQDGLVEIVPRPGYSGIYFARITDEGRQSLRKTAEPADAGGAIPSVPATSGGGLPYHFHPDIERVSGKLFHDGHFKQAALEAYIRVIEAVREKSGLSLDGDDLMNRAFGSDNRIPVIQVNALKTMAERDEQRGFMFLFKGIVGLRNLKAHTNDLFEDPYRAHEYLALSSLLLRILEISSVNKIA
jgi:uncharacterized protein (TIGR02391 family)